MKASLWERTKGVVIAIVVPVRWSLTSGHYRAAISRKSVDATGAPLPWYTYPAIEWLSILSFVEDDILEFGGGYSGAIMLAYVTPTTSGAGAGAANAKTSSSRQQKRLMCNSAHPFRARNP